MMLSNRDLSKTITKNYWFLLIIVTVLFFGTSNGAKNQTNIKNTSTEIEVQNSTELETSSTELEVKEEPYTSVWTMMYDWWNWMIGGYAQTKNAVGEPRTFGAIRRLQLVMIPLVFKFGIVFAMVTALVFLAMKTVLLLKLLLLMNAAAIFAKILLYKTENHYQPPPPWVGYSGGWGYPPVLPSFHGESPLNKEVHLHIHGSNLAHQPWERSDISGYSAPNGLNADATNELNNRGPLPYLRSSQTQPNAYYVNGSG
ncbi:uncharacterized protein LOC129912120 [Episyrphus balteatus]|uniref:uncharacterized protein LOC129912120 n=1 Tax=Episyrphus balteatus TaxID=286459 RepID=UPI0024855C24|nr:uncharacterized protein LOC129912120 [Episyrphus balteatus]